MDLGARRRKKVLALVLAMAMSLSLAVTAGAAFNDQDKIVNTEAVDMCVALNIINGRTDGSFDPAGNVTRAEMAKMICIVLNGGKEPATATKAVPTYADIDGHWAEGYIEYCSTKGVVAGVGGGNFNPNGSVTGSQAAKMLLVALGYNADVEKMVGANWELYTNVLANQDGLYEDLESMDPSAALSRDNAAQMIYNTLNAKTINKTSTIDRVDGSIVDSYSKTNVDLLAAKFGAYNEAGVLSAVKWVEKEGKYKTEVTGFAPFYAAEDYSALMGQTVNVMFEGKATYEEGVFAAGQVDTLYGVYADDDNQTVVTLYGDADINVVNGKNVATIDGEDYDITGITTIATNGAVILEADYAAWANYPYMEVTLVDNNNDDVYDYAVVAPYQVVEVTSLTAKRAYFEQVLDSTKTYNVENDKMVAYDGMAKDDYALLTEATYTVSGDVEVVKAETISGTVEGLKADGSFKMDGTWYSKAVAAVVAPSNGDDLAAVLAINGYYFLTEGATGSADKLAVVLKVGSADFDGDYTEAKLLLSDGTTAVTKAYIKSGNDKVALTSSNVGTMFTYTANNDGYVLEAITDGADIGMDAGAALTGNYSSITNKVASTRVSADAQVFVLYDKEADGAYAGKLISGATADKWADNTYTVTAAYTDGNVEIMVVDLDTASDIPNATDDSLYAVILSETYTTTVDGDTYTVVEKMWTESGMVTDIMFETDVTSILVKNSVITYKMDGEDYVDPAVVPSSSTDLNRTVAITDVNGEYFTILTASGGTAELKVDADDTVVLYVDTEAGDGLTEGAIKEAAKYDAGKYYANATVIYKQADSADESRAVLCVVVDVNNMMQDADGDDILVNIP